MTFQICQCGAEPGYLHREDCPYPLYNARSDAQLERWEEARKEKLFPMKGNAAISLPPEAIADLLLALYTASVTLMQNPESPDEIEAASIKELLLIIIRHHPEEDVREYYRKEIERLPDGDNDTRISDQSE